MVKAWCLVNEPLEWVREDSRVDPSEDFVALELIRLANVEEWRHVKFVGPEFKNGLIDLKTAIVNYLNGHKMQFPPFTGEGFNKKVDLYKSVTTASFVWHHSEDHPYKDAQIR